MKVLIVADLHKLSNPFVSTIASKLTGLGLEVTCSQSEFWNNPEGYDIIHFQWPEILFDWRNTITDDELYSLSEMLSRIKKAEIPMCITVHNLKPHSSNNTNLIKSFEIIYNYCSGFFHMGEYSKTLFEKVYPQASHFVIPHHIYDSIYKFEESFQPHHWIEKGKVNLLAFGAFRNKEERILVLRLINDDRFKNVNFILPGFCKASKKSVIDKFTTRFLRIWYHLRGIKFSSSYISDHEAEQLFMQADIVLIQRISILNSGNLPFAFAAGKVVVGPYDGNVGSILKETNNPLFSPTDIKSVADAVAHAISLCKTDVGTKNKEYAWRYWRSENIAAQMINAYKRLNTQKIK